MRHGPCKNNMGDNVGAKGNSVDTVIWSISLVRLSPNPVSTVIFVNSTQVILLSRHDRAIIANQFVSPLLEGDRGFSLRH